MPAKDRQAKSRVREEHQDEILFTLAEWLISHPEEIGNAAEYVGCTEMTVRRWIKENRSSVGGEATFLQEGFLRRKGVIDPIIISDQPTIPLALSYGLSEKVFTASAVAAQIGLASSFTVFQYAYEEVVPHGMNGLQLEWFLHNTIVKDVAGNTRPLRPMPRLESLAPEVSHILIACCKKELAIETIATDLNTRAENVLRWFRGEATPIPSLLSGIRRKWYGNMDDRKTPVCIPAAPVRSPVVDSSKPIEEPAKPIERAEISAPPLATNGQGVTKPIRQIVLEQSEVTRAILLGWLLSLPPSQAIKEIKALRESDPCLWFELNILGQVMASPDEYTKWRRSRG